MIWLFVAAASAWSLDVKRDPMSDATEVTATLKGEGGEVVLMCSPSDRRAVFLFHFEDFLGGGISKGEWREFSYRLDDKPAVKTQWKYLKNSVVAPSEETPGFVAGMSAAQALKVRAVGYDNSFHDASFSLAGTTETMAKARAICYPTPK